MARDYAIVVYGATGASGHRSALHLQARQKDGPAYNWAIAGRNRDSLERMSRAFDARPAVIAAALDEPAALQRLAAQADVVLNLAGPYGAGTATLIEACIEQRTHYLDLCGQNSFLRSVIDRYHARAQAARVKVVPAAGYESLLFDLGTLLLAKELHGRSGSRCAKVSVVTRLRVTREARSQLKNTPGFLQTLLTSMQRDPDQHLLDPYHFAPGSRPGAAERHANRIDLSARRAHDGHWLAPLAPNPFLNPPMIQRSRALAEPLGDSPYAPAFVYHEAMDLTAITEPALPALPARACAELLASSMRRMVAMSEGRNDLGDRAMRALFEAGVRNAKTAPDRVGSDALRYELEFSASAASGRELGARMSVQGDPGYASTGRIAAEAALALAQEPELPAHYGVVTPALALGPAFKSRFAAIRIDWRM